MGAVGSQLMALKQSGSFRIFGSSWVDIGREPYSDIYGALSPGLILSVEGVLFVWGTEGPWMIRPTEGSQDLEDPINLSREAPEGLPTPSDSRLAFAVYIPEEKSIEWHFGNRIYTLTLRELRWSYRERSGIAGACGTLLYGTVASDDIVGYPEIRTIRPQQAGQAEVEWGNVNQDGDELLELWIKLHPQEDA